MVTTIRTVSGVLKRSIPICPGASTGQVAPLGGERPGDRAESGRPQPRTEVQVGECGRRARFRPLQVNCRLQSLVHQCMLVADGADGEEADS